MVQYKAWKKSKAYIHTSFDEVVVCVTPEIAIREKGDNGIDRRHVQNPDTVVSRDTAREEVDEQSNSRNDAHLPLLNGHGVIPIISNIL